MKNFASIAAAGLLCAAAFSPAHAGGLGTDMNSGQKSGQSGGGGTVPGSILGSGLLGDTGGSVTPLVGEVLSVADSLRPTIFPIAAILTQNPTVIQLLGTGLTVVNSLLVVTADAGLQAEVINPVLRSGVTIAAPLALGLLAVDLGLVVDTVLLAPDALVGANGLVPVLVNNLLGGGLLGGDLLGGGLLGGGLLGGGLLGGDLLGGLLGGDLLGGGIPVVGSLLGGNLLGGDLLGGLLGGDLLGGGIPVVGSLLGGNLLGGNLLGGNLLGGNLLGGDLLGGGLLSLNLLDGI